MILLGMVQPGCLTSKFVNGGARGTSRQSDGNALKGISKIGKTQYSAEHSGEPSSRHGLMSHSLQQRQVFSGGDSPAVRESRGVSITTNDQNNMNAFLQKFHGGGNDHFGESIVNRSIDTNIFNTEGQYSNYEQVLGSGVGSAVNMNHQIAARVITTSQNNRESHRDQVILPISRRDGFDQNTVTEGGHATEDSLIMDTANMSGFNPDIQNLSGIEPGLPSKKIIKHKSKLSKI